MIPLSYQTLDAIAVAYTPLLATLALASVAIRVNRSHRKVWELTLRFGMLIDFLIVAYGIMYLDNTLKLWPHFGLDYSTHTAVASALIFYLTFLESKYWLILLPSFTAYLGLMLYQDYHSLGDIASSLLSVLPLYLLICYLYNRFRLRIFSQNSAK